MSDDLLAIAELGDDTELLLAPDSWLENQRVALQQQLALISDELRSILGAIRLKNRLQQQNKVAVRCVERDTGGRPCDIIIHILPLTEALTCLDRDRSDSAVPSDVSEENAEQQHNTWRQDGYDLEAAKRLKRKKND